MAAKSGTKKNLKWNKVGGFKQILQTNATNSCIYEIKSSPVPCVYPAEPKCWTFKRSQAAETESFCNYSHYIDRYQPGLMSVCFYIVRKLVKFKQFVKAIKELGFLCPLLCTIKHFYGTLMNSNPVNYWILKYNLM